MAENTPVLGTPYTSNEIASNVPQNNYNCGGMVDLNYSKPGAQAYVNSVVNESLRPGELITSSSTESQTAMYLISELGRLR